MGAQRRPLYLPLLFGTFIALAGRAQTTTHDLEVDVGMDTVLYDGLNGCANQIPEGFRRYNLYAVIPEGASMVGPSADNVTIPNIPPFGFQTDCGCYEHPTAEGGVNFGASINPGFFGLYPELNYDTWWTTYLSSSSPLGSPSIAPGTFPPGFNACSDSVVQGALFVTPGDPLETLAENGRALIGQITTCESFRFQGCVAFRDENAGLGSVYVQCTDGYVEVEDLCAPMIDPLVSTLQGIDCFGDLATVEVVPGEVATADSLAFTSTVEYTRWELTETDTSIAGVQVGEPIFTGSRSRPAGLATIGQPLSVCHQ